jgi:hypothetical protein
MSASEEGRGAKAPTPAWYGCQSCDWSGTLRDAFRHEDACHGGAQTCWPAEPSDGDLAAIEAEERS